MCAPPHFSLSGECVSCHYLDNATAIKCVWTVSVDILEQRASQGPGQDPEAWKVLSAQDLLHHHLLSLEVDKDNCLLQGSFFPPTRRAWDVLSCVFRGAFSLCVEHSESKLWVDSLYHFRILYWHWKQVSWGSLLLMVLFKLTQKAATGTPKEFDQLLKIVYIPSDKYQMFMWVTHT